MTNIDLDEIEREMLRSGYCVRRGSLLDVSTAAIGHPRWSKFERAGARSQSASILTPATQEEARPRSLSAVYGLGAQPLHTDGAHLRVMPDVIVLHSREPSSTATIVWRLASTYPSALESGIFTVRGDEGSFLSHAFDGEQLRFDPGCMSAADHLAKEAQQYFENQRPNAHTHHWTDESTLLFIDNRRCLHAREAIANEEDAHTRRLERAAYTLAGSR